MATVENDPLPGLKAIDPWEGRNAGLGRGLGAGLGAKRKRLGVTVGQVLSWTGGDVVMIPGFRDGTPHPVVIGSTIIMSVHHRFQDQQAGGSQSRPEKPVCFGFLPGYNSLIVSTLTGMQIAVGS